MLLWELITGQHAYKGMPATLTTHKVCLEGLRPPLPPNLPPKLTALVQECWAADPALRPAFPQVLQRLGAIRSDAAGSAWVPAGVAGRSRSVTGGAAPDLRDV